MLFFVLLNKVWLTKILFGDFKVLELEKEKAFMLNIMKA